MESIRHGVQHIGYWVDDITAEAKRLGVPGFPSFATAGHAPQLPAQLSRDLWRSFFSVAGQDGVELVEGADRVGKPPALLPAGSGSWPRPGATVVVGSSRRALLVAASGKSARRRLPGCSLRAGVAVRNACGS